MAKAQNIYDYKPPKSGNDEVSYFLTKGRIRRKAFFLRLLLIIVLLVISNSVMKFYAMPQYQHWSDIGGGEVRNQIFLTTYRIFVVFNNIILPAICGLFLLVQGAKRMHDINKSGWYFLFPVYDLFMLLAPGTVGQNDYGIDPKPQKLVKYFDELEKKK
ncbi:hypothetical protein AGMMS50239_35470 [Bacteroidia bacterium]|nr:hypothetical protein AGMMS50239_35470 [Bacteroidia bacterium]